MPSRPLEGDPLGSISAFVGVASQLILIKSRALLPRQPAASVPLTDGGIDPEAELRARLVLYRAFRDAGAVLQARARLIRAALAEASPVVLQDLVAGVRDRVVVAVTFLALLELVKRREVTVEQDRPWGPILVRSTPRPTTPAGKGSGHGTGGDAFDEHLEEYG